MKLAVFFRSLLLAGCMGFGAAYLASDWIRERINQEEFDPWSAYEQMPVQTEDPMAPNKDRPEPMRPLNLDPRRTLGRYPGDEGKNHTRVKAAFKSVVSPINDATVNIWCDDKEKVLGTIVSANGEIITKASELAGQIQVQLRNGKKYPAQVLGVSRENDLALLKINAEKLTPVAWREGVDPALGSFLVTVSTSDEPVAIGVLSVQSRKISVPSGLLGILLDQGPAGPTILNVLPESAAEQAGLQARDVVQQVNEKVVSSREELIETISNFRPGDKLLLKVKRGSEVLEIIAVLGRPETARPANAPGSKNKRTEDERLAGDLSERRGGFPAVLQHDTVLRPQQMGGPIIDLDGKAVGLNIARADRVATYALPTKTILTALTELRAGKLPAPPELRGDNRARLEAQIKSLEESLKLSEKQIKDADDLVKKAKQAATEAEKQLAKSKTDLAEKEASLKLANEAKAKFAADLKSAQDRLKILASEAVKQ